ncbi:hypothetical protein NA56DRAFT_655332 [Hyaloscypha hepaticicola]|uniref:Uncharacterized protein n=1 Tax=Hyaloscypha hepaticicola TaxID=2082293 RepID=A0A2J6QI46_9HELO|nr:hypothetical protein NA56DRAFT_655332 [Hyaloscypha hepaticicola]
MGRARKERASKQAKQSKAKQVPSASWYWTKDLPGNQRLQRLSRGAACGGREVVVGSLPWTGHCGQTWCPAASASGWYAVGVKRSHSWLRLFMGRAPDSTRVLSRRSLRRLARQGRRLGRHGGYMPPCTGSRAWQRKGRGPGPLSGGSKRHPKLLGTL